MRFWAPSAAFPAANLDVPPQGAGAVPGACAERREAALAPRPVLAVVVREAGEMLPHGGPGRHLAPPPLSALADALSIRHDRSTER